jgi:hypothetical protein
MLLSIAVGISVVAPLALIVAIVSGSVLFGWFTVGASVVGLLLLIIGELLQHGRRDAESTAEERSSPTELADEHEVLRPDIWPPEHPAHDARGDGDQVEPERVRDGDRPRPDIWP